MTTPRPTKWWQGQSAQLKTEIGNLFADAEFCALFDTAVEFSLKAGRVNQMAKARAANLRALGEYGDAAILVGQGNVFIEKIREMAQPFLSALVAAASSASPRLRQSLGEEGLMTNIVEILIQGREQFRKVASGDGRWRLSKLDERLRVERCACWSALGLNNGHRWQTSLVCYNCPYPHAHGCIECFVH